ncbi:MAG: TonB-dependent vitamin B12 receptor [Sulfuricella sp.]
MKSSFKLSLISLAILAPAAQAAAEEMPLYRGDEIVVTATRTARTADETLAATTVITRRDIERSQATSVQDLLQGLAGVSIANNGGAGKATSVLLRGTNSDHVVVLIDGVKVGSATLGTAAFQDFPVEQIERIEVVRGPLSSLYGSEAIGGVIQIFTRKGGGALMPSASVMLGSYNTRQAAANLSGGGENGWFNLGLSQLETDGFNACKGSLTAGCYTIEPDKDGYRNTSLNLRAGYRFKPGSEVDFHLLRAQGHNDFDGSFQNQSASVQQVAGLSLKHQASELWSLKLAAGQSEDDADNFLNGVFKSRFNTRRNTLSWQNDLALAPDHLFTLGLDRQEDAVSSTTAYTVTSRDTTGLFAQYLGRAGKQDFLFSLRRDDNNQFGAYTTGNAAWGRALADGLRVTLAYGTAFKAPTFNQLYYPGFGNPNLKPEHSRSLEAGLSGKTGASRWSLNAFETRVTDLIGFDGVTNPVNASARIRGLEAISSLRLADWDTRLNLTLQNPENRSNTANFGKVLNRRAEQSLRLDLDRDFGPYRMGATLRAEGRRYDNLANTTKLSGYGLVDLRAEYRLTRDLRLQARIENLFDRDYETVYLYNQPGRSLFVTLRYQPAK